MAFVQVDTTIPIDLAVTRYRTFLEDGMVQIWGHVGDYEVCVHLPLDDARLRPLLGSTDSTASQKPKRSSRKMKKNGEGE
jgi:hypothetical protein